MSRYDIAMTLYNVSVEVDENGVAQKAKTDMYEVFANRYSMGASTWAAARSVGLHADAQVALRSMEYEGQEIAEIDGIEYEIERVSEKGEFTTLTLKRRLSNE